MRKFFVLTLAALLAVGAGTAHAGGYRDYGYRDYGHRHHDRPHRDAYLVGGLLLGLAAGAALSDRDDRYDYRDDRRHGRYDDDRYWHDHRGHRYGYGPRYGREVVVYREVRRPVYRDRYYYAPPRRHYGYRYGYRGW
jgi:hypothetical protein